MENVKIEELYRRIAQEGFVRTVGKTFGVGACVRVPFTDTALKTDVLGLDLSVRSTNCLMRAGVKTVAQLLDVIAEDRLWSVRNLGKKSRAEIRVKTFEFGYACLSEKEKKGLIGALLTENSSGNL